MNETSTPELSVDLLKSGDRAEFARLVDAYYTPIYRLGLKMLGDSADAEDVLQNTFLKALQHLPGFEGRSSLSTWLYRIAANEALMLLRKRRPSLPVNENLDEDDEGFLPTQFTDWCCLPEHEFLTDESKSQLDLAIQGLPETLKVVFLLRDIEGLSIRETSEALGLSETAVKTRLLRARLHLRESLSSYYGERLDPESAK
ncbi:MAG: sigma-70 family RNA polymerase sigma factor [Anaerolineales bacterium]|jgi:RNA polymerase sigma-70 factor (ECF subfamily)|nr:sigma-70 family RNA polymerase sigma factor [Anaerolineales bacterium]